jgi:tetratricopeptide (TPR) repeat protein
LANPRIDDLRRKLDKEPGSRLFAQLAEELRKEGHLDEAIRVARTGLDKHPAYPSARMTLGRALLDNGELAAARREFDSVLKGAADNILASRYLAECLEGLGQHAEALVRYRATLAMAPGDRQIMGRIEALERRAAVPAAAVPGAGAPGAGRGLSPQMGKVAGQAADPMAGAEEVFEVEPEIEPDAVSASDAPIPLVPVDDDEFELERPLDARAALAAAEPASAAPPPVAPPAPADVPVVYAREVIFEPDPEPEPEPAAPPVEAAPPPPPPQEHTLEARRPDLTVRPPELGLAPAPVAAEPSLEDALPEAEVLDEEFDMEPPPSGPMQMTFRAIVDDVPSAAPRAPAAGEPELASPTLAELYFDQGFLDKAAEVYRRLLARDPGQERWRARLGEIESVQRLHARAQTSPPPPASLPSDRRAAVERAIARLQDLRAALARRN